ncbi:hypothetical protein L3Y34_018478 [Caenorhabditis briggsae]|uniref:Uncharacterized protein n=1 Tax=Caenorhabditis briggsae TaxID=6238 RepID=A0AAE9IUQ4_CAEBR|nr:hypothetical protein L3Y34_018478 [Caenorhabditis briggsae]
MRIQIFRIKLSMSYFKIEVLLRRRKYRIIAFHIRLRNDTLEIDIKTSNGFPSVLFEKTKRYKTKPLTQLVQLQNRYQKEIDGDMYLNHVSIEEIFSIYRSLHDLFSCSSYDWIFLLDELKLYEFREYTERILTTEFTGFIVHVGSISNESLVELTKEFPEKANIIIDLDISSDYSNAKALKFHAVDYKEAR